MSLSEGTRVRLAQVAILLGVLVFLEVAPRQGWVGRLTLVPVSSMLTSLIALLQGGVLTPHILATAFSVAASLTLAVLVGVPLGILLWRLEWLQRVLDPYLTTYYAVPIFAFYPLLIALLGLDLKPIIIIAWAWSVVAVIVNTALGLRRVPRVYRKVAASLGLSARQTFVHVYFPAASPHVFTGFKLAVIYSLVGVIASEFILATRGLGWFISYQYNNFGLAKMYAGIVLVLVASTVINALVLRTERRIYGRRAD